MIKIKAQAQTTLSKWGNSLGIRIPAHIVRELDIRDGDEVTLEVVEGGWLEIHTNREPRRKVPRYRLEDLLKDLTPDVACID